MLRQVVVGLVAGSVMAHAEVRTGTGNSLDIQSYQKQVEASDPGYMAAKQQIDGAKAVQDSHENSTDMSVFVRSQFNDDRRPTINPGFQGIRTTNKSVALGVVKQMLSGPRFELSQNLTQTNISDANAQAIPVSEFYDAYPKVEVSVPLWRNFMGRMVKSEQNRVKGQNDVLKFNSENAWVKTNGAIEMTFYSYVAAKEQFQIQQDILNRAEKIYEWASTRATRGLTDRSDTYQSEASVKVRKVELQVVEQGLHAVAREFNRLRGIQADQVSEDLKVDELPIDQLLIKESNVKLSREMAVSRSQMLVQESTYLTAKEMTKPQLDLNLSAQWYGRDAEYREAFSETYKENQSNVFVGLQFTMPLDGGKYNRLDRGYSALAKGEELRDQAVDQRAQVDWQNFVSRGQMLHKKVKLLRELEAVQMKTADAERRRLINGRSTTFQVLKFEQDYITARSQRIAVELEARQYILDKSLYQ